jgi:hypothetical protein
MKIQIALGSASKNYSDWQNSMKSKENFGEIKRLDDNKLVAVDTAGNIIETFLVENERKNTSIDTLDGQQTGTPSDKTENDVRVDSTLEKGA